MLRKFLFDPRFLGFPLPSVLQALYVAHMVRRILLCSFGRMRLDDKDYYGNKVSLALSDCCVSLRFGRYQVSLRLALALIVPFSPVCSAWSLRAS